jgi:hypothetical protein
MFPTRIELRPALVWDITRRCVVIVLLLRLLIREDGTDTLSQNVGNNYHTTLRDVPEEPRSHQHSGGSLKSRIELFEYLFKHH